VPTILDPETGETIQYQWTPELTAEIDKLYKDSCKHPNKRTVRRIISGGNIIIQDECVECLTLCGSSQRRKPGWEKLPLHDAKTRSRYERAEEQLKEDAVLYHARKQQIASAKFQYEYEEYRKGAVWKRARDAVMQRDKFTCQGCGANPATEVHHKSYHAYRHAKRELLFDLVALCRDCHKLCHADKYPDEFKLRSES
jgi:hypothetical protein